MDLEQFRTRSPQKPRRTRPQQPLRRKRRGWFLKGPIPGEWLSKVVQLPGRALNVAIALWFLAGVAKSRRIKPTWATWQRFGVSPDTGRRGLAALEHAGLVAVDRHSGRCPLVTILEVRDETPTTIERPLDSCGSLAARPIAQQTRSADDHVTGDAIHPGGGQP